ncbi:MULTISPECIES: hypothetical protein [Bradyrhizobium]|uniref:hypothetical protein n=1 Tax=Bradyrhizobium TaxID=374 RepID=UPI00114D128E|nr:MULTISPECIES: hypothetical protein [Bradyrhizobium]MCP1838881.1 hypothetical protein [Bradyrhizobium sp. USDA 4538]MCP1899448.1 hypothetical protein [Bradyrhizobium sp. USDA 4537]MCP1909726.1 hypothetical protein [Bradyrhizobium elkanii]MCP1986441.1 hypothetical protein [Bradyrhizobium sp. USDA 4539]
MVEIEIGILVANASMDVDNFPDLVTAPENGAMPIAIASSGCTQPRSSRKMALDCPRPSTKSNHLQRIKNLCVGVLVSFSKANLPSIRT